jgi:hypothetical protein
MGLSVLKRSRNSDQEETITDLTNDVEKCCTETRTLSYLLHPPLLEELGLTSAVNWYVEGFIQRSKIEVNLFVAPEFNQRLSEASLPGSKYGSGNRFRTNLPLPLNKVTTSSGNDGEIAAKGNHKI